MCGILCVFGSQEEEHALRQRIVKLQAKLRHRGPDWSGLQMRKAVNGTTNALAHERLAIVDLVSGEQPLENETGEILLSANGEIYNHKVLAQSLTKKHEFKTHSDCEVIIHLYEEIGAEVPTKLDGMFSFVLYDHKNQNVVAARDPLGITPLYFGHGEDGSVWFASEMKAIIEVCPKFEEFPPGHVWTTDGGLKRWYYPSWWNEEVPTTPVNMDALRSAFEGAVVKRLMTDVPYGVLLSGGLDSSLVASVASRHAAKRVEEDEKCDAWWPKLHSFSIGLPGSPDLKNAALVAKFLGTVHHEWTFTVQQGIDALPDVIYHIESYDVTSIRASTPMYLMARRIKAMGVKMVLSGEGSDEIFGGYLYFHKAPNSTELHKETCRKLKGLHSYDLLRANKAMAAWGVEARVPFLDQKFLSLAMGFDPKEKMITKDRMEKWVIRKTFDTPEKPYLPDSVLWRQKEQFSDGVGYGWIDGLKAYAETKVTDSMLSAAKHKFPENTPVTKEGYLYRSIFERYYPTPSAVATIPGGPSVACSTAAAVEWDRAWKANLDPSGRAVVGVHVSAYNDAPASK